MGPSDCLLTNANGTNTNDSMLGEMFTCQRRLEIFTPDPLRLRPPIRACSNLSLFICHNRRRIASCHCCCVSYRSICLEHRAGQLDARRTRRQFGLALPKHDTWMPAVEAEAKTSLSERFSMCFTELDSPWLLLWLQIRVYNVRQQKQVSKFE